jgi:hypothetical protein
MNNCSAALIDLTPSNGVNSASSVKLSDLVSGQVMGLQVGDKVFTNFTYTPTGDMPAAQDVNVLGFEDPQGNWGISLHGTFVDLPGGAATSQATLQYQAQVDAANTQLGRRITDLHLFLGGVGADAGSNVEVNETSTDVPALLLHAYLNTSGQGSQQLSEAAILTSPLQTIHIRKIISAAAAANAILPARATAIDQSFSQNPVPEPASLVLAMMGVITFVACRRFN